MVFHIVGLVIGVVSEQEVQLVGEPRMVVENILGKEGSGGNMGIWVLAKIRLIGMSPERTLSVSCSPHCH